MTITAADIKIGMCIEMDGKTFLVVDFQHCKPGKGPAFHPFKLQKGSILPGKAGILLIHYLFRSCRSGGRRIGQQFPVISFHKSQKTK